LRGSRGSTEGRSMAEISAVADHKPYVADETRMAEFTPKAVIVGAMFGLIFGASTVYLALKAGLTVSASIPIAVLSISLLKKLGGAMARIADLGLAFSGVKAALPLIFGVVAATPGYVPRATSRIFPAATVNAAITPEYMGVGYIIGPRIAGVLVAGGVIGWLGIIPLIASLVPQDTIAQQLVKLGYLADIARPGVYGWDPATHTFAVLNQAIYRAYVRQIG